MPNTRTSTFFTATAERDPTAVDGFVRLPIPSRATRRRSLRGETSHRGSVVLQKHGNATDTHFESGLERKALLVNGTRRDVVDVVEQPRRVRYLEHFL